jgi:hypothetical protein
MIDDILAMGATRALRVADEELESILLEVWTRAAKTSDTSQVSLRVQLEHTRKLSVQRSQIERALSNIVFNALEAMGGTGALWFESRDVEGAGRPMVELTIGNSGSFIEPEQLQRIFEPFVTLGKRHGTGLGLTIAKRAIELHGGSLRPLSSRERGVEFILTLPASAALREGALSWTAVHCSVGAVESSEHSDLPLARKAATASATGAVEPRHVVLVEDSPGIRLAWRSRLPPGVLQDFGSPAELLAALQERPALLREALCVVLDNHFQPGQMEGLDLGKLLRAETAAPILLCTGVPVDPLPAWCNGQLAKETLALEELQAAARL